uniref:Uncharacterized protein n=1 Tax=Arundo donax TaxID=35708 RepID=A0A0A8XXV7_ARUDO
MEPGMLLPVSESAWRFSISTIDSGIGLFSLLFLRSMNWRLVKFDIVAGSPPIKLLSLARKVISCLERFPI